MLGLELASLDTEQLGGFLFWTQTGIFGSVSEVGWVRAPDHVEKTSWSGTSAKCFSF